MRDVTLRLGQADLMGLESAGTGLAVLLCHGNSASASLFRPLLESELGRRHRMIALDFPGHGRSNRMAPATEAYSIPGFAQIVVAAVRELGLSEYVLVGHSLGGHVMTAALASLPEARGLLLVSAPPLKPGAVSEAMKEDPTVGAMFGGTLDAEQVERFAGALLEPANVDAALVRELRASIGKTDPAFRPALLKSLAGGLMQDEQAILARTNVPTALAYGTEDRFIRPEYCNAVRLRTAWGGGILAFPGSGHCLHLDNPDRFRKLLADLLASAERRHDLQPEIAAR